jgi:GTP-binding protein
VLRTDRARIAIIGRPNVGKSTLFNRMVGRRKSLVHNEPGVTRDRIVEEGSWTLLGKEFAFELLDTGGIGGERFDAEIRAQVTQALEGADAVVLVTDSREGIVPLDEEVLQDLQRSGILSEKPVIVAANKVDDSSHELRAAEFYALGFEHVIPISAEHDRGVETLKETLKELLPDWQPLEEAPVYERPENSTGLPQIAIVGRPNVGKSTLFNKLSGATRSIASPVAGTTVDAIDTEIELGDHTYLFVDTAGIRRKSKTEQGVEVLSVIQTKKALERADVALLLLDAETGPTDQDEKVAGLIEEAGCSLVILLNKWDLHKGRGDEFSQKDAEGQVRGKMGQLNWAPLMFVSALKGGGLTHLGDLIADVLEARRTEVGTPELTQTIKKAAEVANPRNAKFYYSHQASKNPPTFVLHVNSPENIHFSLKRHLTNVIRERWGFFGSPIRMIFRPRKSMYKN